MKARIGLAALATLWLGASSTVVAQTANALPCNTSNSGEPTFAVGAFHRLAENEQALVGNLFVIYAEPTYVSCERNQTAACLGEYESARYVWRTIMVTARHVLGEICTPGDRSDRRITMLPTLPRDVDRYERYREPVALRVDDPWCDRVRGDVGNFAADPDQLDVALSDDVKPEDEDSQPDGFISDSIIESGRRLPDIVVFEQELAIPGYSIIRPFSITTLGPGDPDGRNVYIGGFVPHMQGDDSVRSFQGSSVNLREERYEVTLERSGARLRMAGVPVRQGMSGSPVYDRVAPYAVYGVLVGRPSRESLASCITRQEATALANWSRQNGRIPPSVEARSIARFTALERCEEEERERNRLQNLSFALPLAEFASLYNETPRIRDAGYRDNAAVEAAFQLYVMMQSATDQQRRVTGSFQRAVRALPVLDQVRLWRRADQWQRQERNTRANPLEHPSCVTTLGDIQ